MHTQTQTQTRNEPIDAVDPNDQGREIRLVRLRLALVTFTTGLIALVTGALLEAIVAPDPGHRLGLAIHAAPLAWLAGGVLLFLAASALTVTLAHRVIAPVRRLDAGRRHFGALYAAAESRALVDAATGLGNHRAFQEEFERQIDLCRRHGYPLTLVLLDLDDFKAINDARGHAIGDLLLAEVSRVAQTVFRKSDRLFRVGGDEFAVLLPHASVENGYRAARRLLVAAGTQRPGLAFPDAFSFSAGVTGTPEFGATRVELVDQAGLALAAAKQEGRTLIKVYDATRSTGAVAGPLLAHASAAVAAVIERRAVGSAYQPIVDLASGRVIGFEGLTRPTPDAGFEEPAGLFAAAEATGRTVELDRLCMETLLAGANGLEPDQWLSLNVSPATVESDEFSAAWLSRLLARGGLAPNRIVLEVTERTPLRDVELVQRRLAACQAMGARIAIDDVGAGNAGLRLLSEIRFDIVKIDLSLVQAGARDGSSRDVLRSITELAGRWGAMALAEGVETAAELRVVREIGLPAAQGYLLGRPQPTADLRTVELAALLREPDLRTVLTGGLSGTTPDMARAALGLTITR